MAEAEQSEPSEKDKSDYKEGKTDAEKGVVDQAIIDIPVNHPDTKPYYDAREGKPLEPSKKD
jgi:hypothetical protein